MNVKQFAPAASIAAISLHDYAQPSDRPATEDVDIGHDTADLTLEDPVDGSEETASTSTRKVPVETLGTAISSKATSKREPLPMKLRALPRSFWEQPNTNQSPSPGYLFAPLPPLTREETIPEVNPMSVKVAESTNSGGAYRSVNNSSFSNSSGLDFLPSTSPNRGVVSPADTDLLFSLFRAVEKSEPTKKVSTVRRGRPRRGGGCRLQQRPIRDDDPCLVSSVTEQLLPNLSGTRTSSIPVLRMVSLRAGSESRSGIENPVTGSGTIALPCLQVNPSYSQILSELVVKL